MDVAYASYDIGPQLRNGYCSDSDAAVIGTDLSRARSVASQLRVGRVVINGMTDDPQAPGEDLNSPALAANTAGMGSKRFSSRGPSY